MASQKGTKGKLQSPFAGRYERLQTEQPLLYARCTRLEDLEQAVPAPTTAPQKLADTPGVPSARKKRRLDKADAVISAAGKQPAKPAAQRPEDYNNKEQALGIRSALGEAYIQAQKQEAAAAAAAAKAEPSGFAFGFSVQQQEQQPHTQQSESTGLPASAAAAKPASTKQKDKKRKKQEAKDDKQAAKAAAAASTATPAAPAPAAAAASAEETPLVPRRVFVGGMPFSMEDDDVREFWEECGAVAEVDLMRFPDTGRFKGIAFITFATEDGYKAALACDGEVHNDVRLKVEPCKSPGLKKPQKLPASKAEPEPTPKLEGPAPKTSGYDVAYVGNIHFSVTPTQLEESLEGCTVTKVRLHTDARTHRSKGFAHVHFADEASLDRAVKLDGLELNGRHLRIGYAQPKKKPAATADA